MLRSYLVTAFRNLVRNKVYVIVNSLGLGISLACSIAAYLWVGYDWEFDDFHQDEQVANIYKLHYTWESPSFSGENILSPYALGPAALHEIPAVKQFTRYYFEQGHVHFEGKSLSQGIAFADKSFFSMFDYPVHQGDIKNFGDLQYTVITNKLAALLFQDDDPLGNIIDVKLPGHEPLQIIVAAVIEEIPENSSFTFELMLPVTILEKLKGLNADYWMNWPGFSTYFEVNDKVAISTINKQFEKYAKLMREDGESSYYHLEHFKADYTMSEISGAMVNVRMWQKPLILLCGVAGLIFLIACFNLANTSFSLISKRLREVGIRKTFGANRTQIFSQFVLETGLIMFLSSIVGLTIAFFIVPPFAEMWSAGVGNRWDQLQFGIEDLNGVGLLCAIILMVFAGLAIAGIYPSFINSKVDPVRLLKGEDKTKGTSNFNSILLVGQFSITIIVLVLSLVFIQNSHFMANHDMGFDTDHVITVRFEEDGDWNKFEEAVNRVPGVLSASLSGAPLSGRLIDLQADGAEVSSNVVASSEDLFQILGFRLVSGRGLLTSDIDRSVVVTEKFTRNANLSDPIGTNVTIGDKSYSIVGVIEDIKTGWYLFDAGECKPFVFLQSDKNDKPTHLAIKTELDDNNLVYDRIKELWISLYPMHPFHGVDHSMRGAQLKTSNDLRNTLIFLVIMTVLLSFSGIYALASLNLRKRKKELSIRKLLGASIQHLVKIVNKEFAYVLCLSSVMGVASSYLLLAEITGSRFKILFTPVDWRIYAVAVILVMLLGLLTVGRLTLKSATRNPMKALKAD